MVVKSPARQRMSVPASCGLRKESVKGLSYLYESETTRKRREVRSRMAVLLAALGVFLGAVSCGGDMEDQQEQQEEQEQDDD